MRLLLVGTSLITGALAQAPTGVSSELNRVDELVNSGRYSEATRLADSIVWRLPGLEKEGYSVVFLTYLAKAAVEQGHMKEALTRFESAEAANARSDKRYHPALIREKAALLYAAGEFRLAGELAGQAHRAMVSIRASTLRAEYCRSLQALALLRSGRTSEAEYLAMMATKVLPKKLGDHPFFAPRILYAACVTTAHAGKFAAAEKFCRRGLDAALATKNETRDLVLGHLAYAEYWLQAGDLEKSRESAMTASSITKRLFGDQHQDSVEALVILAAVDRKEGRSGDARSKVGEAVAIATAMFGKGSAAAAVPARALEVGSGRPQRD
ncbi:MAG: hypothetical protein U0Q16_15035 [Bryobacteraceae bacterium]